MVACAHQHGAAGDRVAVHGGHDGQRELEQGAERLRQCRQRCAEVLVALVQDSEQIGTRRERGARLITTLRSRPLEAPEDAAAHEIIMLATLTGRG